MKAEIQEALEPLISPERLIVTLEAVDVLLEQDYVLALDELNTVLMIADDYADSSMLVARVDDVITYAVNYLLNDSGIVVLPETSLEVRLAIINTLLYIPRYIIPEDLAHLFEQGYDDEETLAQLVAFFSTLDSSTVLESIESVDSTTLNYMRATINEKLLVMGHALTTPVMTERIALVNQLIRSSNKYKFSLVLELANAGVRVGRTFDELVTIGFETLESNNVEDIASQLVGLAFFSNLPVDQIWSKVNSTLDEYTDNPMERRLMEDTVRDIKRLLG